MVTTVPRSQYEDVKTLNDLLEEKNKKENLDVHIHVYDLPPSLLSSPSSLDPIQ
jgi:hypothetical protein